jgi:hypothetical protein
MNNQVQKGKPIVRMVTKAPVFQNQPKSYQKDGITLDMEPLSWGPKSNWVTWKSNMKAKIGILFGDLADIIDNDALPEYQIPEVDPIDLAANEQLRMIHAERVKQAVQRQAKSTENYSKVFSYMMLHLRKSWNYQIMH